ncbi:DNA repair protein RecO, partial [Haemophilus influenzae]
MRSLIFFAFKAFFISLGKRNISQINRKT